MVVALMGSEDPADPAFYRFKREEITKSPLSFLALRTQVKLALKSLGTLSRMCVVQLTANILRS